MRMQTERLMQPGSSECFVRGQVCYNVEVSSSVAGASAGSVPGVAVSVLRDALKLMKTQGQTVVTMINSAPRTGGTGAIVVASDPLVGQKINVLV